MSRFMVYMLLGTVMLLTGGKLSAKTFSETSEGRDWLCQILHENHGVWDWQDGILTCIAGKGRSSMILRRKVDSKDYSVEVQFRFQQDKPCHVGLVFRGAAPKSRHELYFTGGIFSVYEDKVRLQMVDPVWRTLKSVWLPEKLRENTWHVMKVKVSGEEILCYLNGTLLISEESGKFPSGTVGLRVASGGAAAFRGFSLQYE